MKVTCFQLNILLLSSYESFTMFMPLSVNSGSLVFKPSFKINQKKQQHDDDRESNQNKRFLVVFIIHVFPSTL